ncbi:DUF4424 family protein [Pseudoduganella violaceinigra]|uniref:DUF4424 family protein n=1 Tax=Pseudoduganella violaceinigra TaxID=246602 RepID=UPI0004291B2F|nr:DUF4424 family protein [Pseudoduganella violaceinigra]
MKISWRFALAALTLPNFALANDGIAAVGVGGIVFGKTDVIAMKKEVLNISHNLISVDYEFLNESASEVEETIVFPLPPYTAAQQGSETYYGQPDGFSIRVDGKPVAFTSRMVARSPDGTDITAQLKKLGLSNRQIAYTPEFSATSGAVPGFTPAQSKQLRQLNLLDEDTGAPTWQVEVNYVWKQKFPARQIIRVHHDYRPFVAAGPGESRMGEGFAQTYCTDQSYLKARARIENKENAYFDTRNVSYILKTGNTWKRGIEDFTLNIIKRRPEELVSLCFPGTFKKIDAHTYQVHLSNFHPTKNLEVHFGNIEGGQDENAGVMPVLPH